MRHAPAQLFPVSQRARADKHLFAREKKMRPHYLLCIICFALGFALAAPALASATSATNLFPDPTGIYYNTNTGFYPTPGGLVTLEGIILSSPTASIPPPVAPGGAVWGVGASFNAQTFMSFFGGPTLPSFN